MQNAQATIYCSNPLCQSPNPESHKFCQKCRTLLPKRYLWAVGQGVETYRPGELLAGRYLIKRSQVVLDTQPGLQPDPIAEIPQFIEPYLRLTPFQLHIPQVYGLIRHRLERSSSEILLLEQAPIYPDGVSAEGNTTSLPLDQPPITAGQLMPELGNVWKQSSALRQLNWLWQITQLWQPLSTEGVATTLLTPALIRVEGSLIRLLELRFDRNATPTLANLAQVWLPLISTARPEISGFLEQICQWMQQGQVRSSEELLTVLDRGLAVCGQAQTRQVQAATLTDQGPTRQRNEDACSPASGTVAAATLSPSPARGVTQLPMVIVCDGIGGHEGGNVASNLAIDAIQQQFSQLPTDPMFLTPVSLKLQLESAIYVANDRISQRNDQEQRQERQRMGTTLVMALAHAHEMYITHVGDSRVYRITRTGCHQVTLDDDVASREVRLGYALYRDALQQAASGSLVQALGMNTSELLHPTVQRLVLDEDCIFLLCSDGLSDNDRVEQNWETEILPILTGQQDVATASKRLVELANTKNGHDNVTVGLIYCRVVESGVVPAQAVMAQLATLPPPAPTPTLTTTGAVRSGNSKPVAAPAPTIAKTKVLPPRRKPLNPIRFFLSSILFLGIAGLLAYILAPNLSTLLGSTEPQPPTTSSSNPETTSPSPVPSLTLPKGALVQLSSASSLATATPSDPVLLSQPADGQNQPTNSSQAAGTVPLGSVVQILGKLEGSGRNNWLNLKVCSTPTPNQATQNSSSPTTSASVTPSPSDRPFTSISPAPTNQAPRSLRPGETGWLLEQEFVPLVSQQIPANAGVCQPAQPSPSPSPNQSTQ